MPTIAADSLLSFAVELLAAAGAGREEAERVARSLVGGNLRGYESHGVMRLPFYIDAVRAGDIRPGAELRVVNESPSNLAADGQWGFGQVQAERVMRRMVAKARESGVGVGTLFQASHIGRLGEYCEMAAAEGLLSMLMANTHGAARRVAPPGGKAPRLGTNPIALGCPYDGEPLVLDFSTSATAEGKVRVKKIAGEQCPEGWLLDSEGRPTTDPNALYGDPPGTILPMGGEQTYKGFGLALMIDIFAGALSGGLVSRETPITPKGNCVFMFVADPGKFGGAEHFADQVRQLVEFVRGCPRTEGCEEILLPGDPERRVLARRQREGVTLDERNWRQLTELAERLGVSSPA